ncbi:MAG: aminoacetone oxidase family FAD-binding enzyme [Planctomycetaceae bacterium]|nr:aminoacetone oxidase family FAD-binding enzyme [Planctomycetaceae bacterium]
MTDDIIVVGAGPAGLAAGIASAKKGRETVCVLERNAVPGRKFLISGSGQCNVTHTGSVAEFLTHYGGAKKARFVQPALLFFDPIAVMRFFEQRGVPLLKREDGKIFPKSLKSGDLLNVLVAELKGRGGKLQTETVVKNVMKTESGFLLSTNRGDFRTKKLILATGGQSYPATGSQGDGFRFAVQLGHHLIEPKPALTPVIVRNYPFGDSSGFSFHSVKIGIHRNGKRLQTGQGDVLLTHKGLSGPGILDLSRNIKPGDELHIALIKSEMLTSDLFAGKKTLKNALQRFGIAERFLVQILESLGIVPDQPATETNRETRKKLELALTGYPFVVELPCGWNEAMATSGGVTLEEVNRQTMESRIIPDLYFCGELLDIDGDTGGYNIQFALSSGFLAGKSSSVGAGFETLLYHTSRVSDGGLPPTK